MSSRLHGPITAITAMATASVLPVLPDNWSLGSLCNATGQTILRSSMYAPIVTSAIDVDIPLATHAVSMPTLPAQSNMMQISSAASKASVAIMYHRPTQAQELHSEYMKAPSSEFHSAPLHLGFSHSMLRQSQQSAVLQSLKPIGAKSWNSFVVPRHPFASHASISQILREFQIGSFFHANNMNSPFASTALIHTWHFPPALSDLESRGLVSQKSPTTVVLLGWLGAEQKHLKKYADWYTSKGMHAITFIVPMNDILSLEAVDKAEQHVDILTENLIQWLKEEGSEKQLIFHTFSNTGWLTYGAVLERLIAQEDKLMNRIKGCIVDSAPSPKPDPQVWASGFSAALLKKGSVATKKQQMDGNGQPQPTLKESALLAMLEKIFSVILQVPYIKRRLNDVVSVLSNKQPPCPQLYLYSSADTVIPAKLIEDFIEEQKKAGRIVRACNLQGSPHVDHFRTYPEKYTEQLASFLKVCIPQWVH